MDLFRIALWLGLAACGLGLAWRVARWFTTAVEPAVAPSPGRRALGASAALARALRPRRWPGLLRALLSDVLLQAHIAPRSPLRWLMHLSIFLGFTGLVLLHAMDEPITANLFPGYEPTLDPFQRLRDLFGLLVLAGLAVAAARRLWLRGLRQVTRSVDWMALALVGAIVCTGFLLEASKIQSEDAYRRMATDYSLAQGQEAEALRAFWALEQGVVFADPPPAAKEIVEAGREANEAYCAYCHAPTSTAFVSYPLARAASGLAPALARLRAPEILYWVHVLLCFLGLAYLPWGKLLHVATTPLNLLLRPGRAVSDTPLAAHAEPLRGAGLDACTRCGECSAHCSVLPAFEALGNADVLPSEKLRSLRKVKEGRASDLDLARFAEGSFICTECHRCTEVCPARIDLQDIWLASKRDLARREQAEPHGLMARRTAAEWAALFRGRAPDRADQPRPMNLTDRAQSFWACVQCTTCTSVCPVVAAADDPVAELNHTPQQIMNLLRMGLKDQALGSGMVWNCVTCYKCQENCPQGIQVADILYELRNIASARLRPGLQDGKEGGW